MERAFDWLRGKCRQPFRSGMRYCILGDIDKIRDIHITYQDEVTA